MKKFLLLVFISISANTFAQFELNKNYAGPSLGLSFLGSSVQLGANFEHSLALDQVGPIGVGGIFRYFNYTEDYYLGEWSYKNVILGAQANYHFLVPDNKFDPWAGIVLGFNFSSVSWAGSNNVDYVSPDNSGLWLGLQGGVRYWITPQIALTGRLSFGSLSYGALEVGADFKF